SYTERVLGQLKREHDGLRVPHIVFTKGGGLWLEAIAASGCDVVGLDWTVNLGQARARIGERVALQGNLDPNVLFAEPEQIRTEVARTLDSYGSPSAGSGHVFNLGHGISQHTPPQSVSVLVEAVHEHSHTQRRS
ncbi:MAG: uroporphyrinogen decarboxylase, partial [Methylibium sp.]|nr:uroporphyrinogen decarboxylase [Methylibium sp.]